jgi:hypothetical protein
MEIKMGLNVKRDSILKQFKKNKKSFDILS